MKRSKLCMVILSFFTIAPLLGQYETYEYQQKISGVSEEWHQVVLPESLFAFTRDDLSDIRVIGITAEGDTIEVPYMIELADDKISKKKRSFRRINESYNNEGYYFTFENPHREAINSMYLKFNQENYDWNVKLEGSNNQKDWYKLLENYRILSIRNQLTDFEFSQLLFPSAKYRYYKIHIDSKEKPLIRSAFIEQVDTISGDFKYYTIHEIEEEELTSKQQSIIKIHFDHPIRAKSVNLNVRNSFDYYRPISISYVSDSFETEKGWKYQYQHLTSGTLNSLDKNEFRFENTTLQDLKIKIENYDNEPLNIASVTLIGAKHYLITRFSAPATYYLIYGSKKARKPRYDIVNFKSNIPEQINEVELGQRTEILAEENSDKTAVEQNKLWLWLIIIFAILVLGWFSFKMLKQEQ